jgi:MoaA/NifB/PqqE/SkfB family radical SAM enzyme
VDSAKDELSLDKIEKIFSSFNHKLLTLVLTGGEVFLRKDIISIIEIAYRHTKMDFLAIPTNGIRYEDIYRSICGILDVYPGNLAINLSIDGVGELHDRIRGVKGNFENVSALYFLLEKLKEKHKRLSIGFNTVLNSMNQDSYAEIFEYVRKHFTRADQHNFEILRGDFRNKSISAPSLEFIKRETPNIQRLTGKYSYHKSGIYQKFLHAAKLHYHNVVLDHLTKRRSLPCYAGSLAGVIDHKGTVYPCELYREIGKLSDYEYDFRKLWFSAKADDLRKEIRKTKCTCTHSCFQFVNILFNPFEYPRLLSPIHFRR